MSRQKWDSNPRPHSRTRVLTVIRSQGKQDCPSFDHHGKKSVRDKNLIHHGIRSYLWCSTSCLLRKGDHHIHNVLQNVIQKDWSWGPFAACETRQLWSPRLEQTWPVSPRFSADALPLLASRNLSRFLTSWNLSTTSKPFSYKSAYPSEVLTSTK